MTKSTAGLFFRRVNVAVRAELQSQIRSGGSPRLPQSQIHRCHRCCSVSDGCRCCAHTGSVSTVGLHSHRTCVHSWTAFTHAAPPPKLVLQHMRERCSTLISFTFVSVISHMVSSSAHVLSTSGSWCCGPAWTRRPAAQPGKWLEAVMPFTHEFKLDFPFELMDVA